MYNSNAKGSNVPVAPVVGTPNSAKISPKYDPTLNIDVNRIARAEISREDNASYRANQELLHSTEH